MKFHKFLNINAILLSPLLLLILLSTQLSTTNAKYATITYQEAETTGLLGWDKQTYGEEDGSVVLQFIKLINNTCSQPQLYLRVIHPNGTITPLNFGNLSTLSPSSNIQDFNFCIGVYGEPYIDVAALKKDYLLISYLDLFEGRMFQRNGIIVDWNKQILG